MGTTRSAAPHQGVAGHRGTHDAGWLLRAWENAATAAPAARGAVLAHEAGAVPTLDAALDLPLDALATVLARLHTQQFGPSAQGTLTCDVCGEVLDVDVPVALVADGAVADPRTHVAVPSGRVLTLRVPTTRDVLAVRDRDDVAAALLARCVTEDRPGGAPQPPPALDAEDRAAVDAALEALAGAAAVAVRAECPACGTSLSAPVDVAEFVWERVQREAPGLLADVADLARSFGWSEADILALSPRRRDAYLELVRRAIA